MTIITDKDVIDVNDQRIDITDGDSNIVMAMAAMQNMGQAMAEDGLYPDGRYLLHEFPNTFRVYVIKDGGNYWFMCNVMKSAEKAWKKKFNKMKDKASMHSGEDKPVYDVPMWIIFDLALNHSVHPFLDEQQFEKVLWQHYPKLWIDPSKAPKH